LYFFGNLNLNLTNLLFYFTNIIDILFNSNITNQIVQFYINNNVGLQNNDKILSTLAIKNTFNSLFTDINSNYYRVNLNYFEYLLYIDTKIQNKSISKNKDLFEFIDYYNTLPVFFTKNIISIIYGEIPKFGIIDQLIFILDTISQMFFINYISFIIDLRERIYDYYMDFTNWLDFLIFGPIIESVFREILTYFNILKISILNNSIFLE